MVSFMILVLIMIILQLMIFNEKKLYNIKMFRFIKKAFFTGLTILSSVNCLTVTPLTCISVTNKNVK